MRQNELTVLLADDDTDDCRFFEEAISGFIPPANFKAVNDGEQLMQLLNKESYKLPDVLFLDLNMPRKNGFECLTEIKQNKKLRDLPVVIFSTSSAYNNMNGLFKQGADVYIRKPGTMAQMIKVIRHALPMASENMISAGKLKYVLNA